MRMKCVIQNDRWSKKNYTHTRKNIRIAIEKNKKQKNEKSNRKNADEKTMKNIKITETKNSRTKPTSIINSFTSRRSSFETSQKIKIKNLMTSNQNPIIIIRKLKNKLEKMNAYITLLKNLLANHNTKQKKIFKTLNKFRNDLNIFSFVNRLKKLNLHYNESCENQKTIYAFKFTQSMF